MRIMVRFVVLLLLASIAGCGWLGNLLQQQQAEAIRRAGGNHASERIQAEQAEAYRELGFQPGDGNLEPGSYSAGELCEN